MTTRVFCWECGYTVWEENGQYSAPRPWDDIIVYCPNCYIELRYDTTTPMSPRELAEYTTEQVKREMSERREPYQVGEAASQFERTTPELNAIICDLLRDSEHIHVRYAVARIEELEAEVAKLQQVRESGECPR